jgi:UDP-glucose 4-epimerase
MTAVAIFGHTGFLGRTVTRQLVAKGVNVLGCARSAGSLTGTDCPSRFREAKCDIRIPAEVDQAFRKSPWPIDTVILLAAEIKFGDDTSGTHKTLFETNVVGAHNVLQALQTYGASHLVYASSMSVYGCPDRLPVNEIHPRRPLSFYGLTKKMAEDLLLWNDRSGALAVTILRLAGLYGGSRTSGGMYRFIHQAARGEAIKVDLTKPVLWDVLHVQDASDAVCTAVMKGGVGGRCFNLDQGESIEVVSLAGKIQRWLSSRSEVIVEGHSESVTFQFDLTAARQVLGYAPVSLEQRVREMAEQLAVPA